MDKVKKCIILSILSLFILSNNVITSSASEIVDNQNIITNDAKIPMSGFIGNTKFEATIPDNSDDPSTDNSGNDQNIDKLPQTGSEVLFWGILLAIFMIILGVFIQNKGYKKEKYLKIDK